MEMRLFNVGIRLQPARHLSGPIAFDDSMDQSGFKDS